MERRRLIASLPLLLLILSSPVHAEQAQFSNVNYIPTPVGPQLNVPLLESGGLKVGPIALHPHFGIAEGVTDNLFRTTQPFGARERDVFTVYAPGVQAQLPFLGQHLIVLNYMANLERYSRFHHENVEDQDRSALLWLTFPGGLTVKGLAQWKDGHDPRGSAVSTAGFANGPNKWFTSTYGAEAQMAERAFVRLRLNSTQWEYIGPNAGSTGGSASGDINTRNRLENYAALALGGRVATRSYLFVEGSAAKAAYEINTPLDNSTYTGTVGLRLEPTGKTQGELKVGWQRKALDRASSGSSNEFSGLNLDGRLFWLPRERTRIDLTLYRRTNETVLTQTSFYVSTGATLSIIQTFYSKWRADAALSYDRDRYSNPTFFDNKFLTREDSYLTAGLGISYQMRPWLGLRAAYTYLERLSNADSIQYNANVAMVSIQAQF